MAKEEGPAQKMMERQLGLHKPAGKQKEPKAGKKKPLYVQIDPDLWERARNAAYWLPGMNLTLLTEDALAREITRLEKANKGPFPKRQKEPKAGRPPK